VEIVSVIGQDKVIIPATTEFKLIIISKTTPCNILLEVYVNNSLIKSKEIYINESPFVQSVHIDFSKLGIYKLLFRITHRLNNEVSHSSYIKIVEGCVNSSINVKLQRKIPFRRGEPIKVLIHLYSSSNISSLLEVYLDEMLLLSEKVLLNGSDLIQMPLFINESGLHTLTFILKSPHEFMIEDNVYQIEVNIPYELEARNLIIGTLLVLIFTIVTYAWMKRKYEI